MVDLSGADAALANDLNSRLRALRSWAPVVGGRAPYWYGQMLTGLVLTLGDGTVRLLTGAYVTDEIKFAARLLVFTDDLLVRVTVAGRSKQDVASVEISAIRRAALQKFGVYGTTSVFEEGSYTYWPGSVSVKLRYEGESKDVDLPLDMPAGEASKEELRALVATLPADLLRS